MDGMPNQEQISACVPQKSNTETHIGGQAPVFLLVPEESDMFVNYRANFIVKKRCKPIKPDILCCLRFVRQIPGKIVHFSGVCISLVTFRIVPVLLIAAWNQGKQRPCHKQQKNPWAKH